MAELVERDWAMEEIEFWENRAKHYRDMIFDLMAKMMKGVKFNSIEWTADGVTLKEKQSGWIPVSEKLPEESGWYLVSAKTGNVTTAYYRVAEADKGGCYWRDGVTKPTAWMPLPEPYKEVIPNDTKL